MAVPLRVDLLSGSFFGKPQPLVNFQQQQQPTLPTQNETEFLKLQQQQPEFTAKNIYEGIYGEKNNWFNADAEFQRLTGIKNSGNFSDAEQLDKQIAFYDNQKAKAAKNAEKLRADAQANGIPLKGFEANNTADETREALNNYYNRTNFLNLNPNVAGDKLKQRETPEYYQNGVLNAKRGWGDADYKVQHLQKVIESGRYTDEQNQEFLKQIEWLEGRKKQFSQDADFYRVEGEKRGYDMSQFGADKTLNEAQEYFNSLQQPTQELLNNETLQENRRAKSNINPLENPTAANITADLTNYKVTWDYYDNVEKQWLYALQNGNLSDKERADVKNQIVTARYWKQQAANSAKQLRESAELAGIDIGEGFDANIPLAEAQRNKMTNDLRAMDSLLNFQSAHQQARDYYNQLIENGVDERTANFVTLKKYGEFMDDNTSQILTGIRDYGSDEKGLLNPMGEILLARLYNENPYAAQSVAEGYARQKDAYGEYNANLRQQMITDYQKQAAADREKSDWEKLLFRENALLERERLKNISKATGVSEDKLEQEITSLENKGIPRNVATEMVLRQHYSKSFEPTRNSDGSIKITDAEKAGNVIDFRLGTIKHYLEKGDNAVAKDLIEEYITNLKSDDFKYQEQLDGETAANLLNTLELYLKVANGEMTLEELQAMANGSKKSMSDLKRTNYDNDANEKARQIAEENHKKQEEEKRRRENYEKGRANLVNLGDNNGTSIVINPNPEKRKWKFGYNGNGGAYGTPIYFKSEN